MTHTLAVVLGERLARYGFPDAHPFGPDRHAAFVREFEARGLYRLVDVLEPVEATVAELERFHTRAFIDFVRERSQTGQGLLDGGDTPAYRGVFEAASTVVGSTLRALEAIQSGQARRGFVPIAGLHHAARDRAAGFCVFNDIGVVIETLKAAGLERIAYVDIDAHHGDGVFYAFESDPAVVGADLHEDGAHLYPGTGAREEVGRGTAVGLKLNIPLPPGADDAAFAAAWEVALAHIARHEPQFILLQCGADSIGGDPITHLALTPASHARVARDLRNLAESLGHGKVLATGGGGYDRRNLAAAWSAVVEALI